MVQRGRACIRGAGQEGGQGRQADEQAHAGRRAGVESKARYRCKCAAHPASLLTRALVFALPGVEPRVRQRRPRARLAQARAHGGAAHAGGVAEREAEGQACSPCQRTRWQAARLRKGVVGCRAGSAEGRASAAANSAEPCLPAPAALGRPSSRPPLPLRWTRPSVSSGVSTPSTSAALSVKKSSFVRGWKSKPTLLRSPAAGARSVVAARKKSSNGTGGPPGHRSSPSWPALRRRAVACIGPAAVHAVITLPAAYCAACITRCTSTAQRSLRPNRPRGNHCPTGTCPALPPLPCSQRRRGTIPFPMPPLHHPPHPLRRLIPALNSTPQAWLAQPACARTAQYLSQCYELHSHTLLPPPSPMRPLLAPRGL